MNAQEKRDWAMLIGGIVIFAIAMLLLQGCWSSNREERSQTQAQTRTVIGPVMVDTPIGPIATRQVEIRQTAQEQTMTNGTTSHEITIPPAVADGGAGLLSLVPGVGGILAAGWAVLGRNKAMGALKACAQGLEEFKADADPKVVDRLHANLSSKMDASHKQLVKKVKA